MFSNLALIEGYMPEPVVPPQVVRLEAFREKVRAVRDAVAADQELPILIATNDALFAFYALWNLLEVTSKNQVAWAGSDEQKQNLVALVYVRGETEHRGAHPAMAVGFGEAPFGCGVYGGGWMWRECPTSRSFFAESQRLYDSRVLWQGIAAPLEQAEHWFTDWLPRTNSHPR